MNKAKQDNIYDLHGIEKVFKFTLCQTFKNKTNIFSLIMMFAMTFIMPLMMNMGANAGETAVMNQFEVKAEDATITDIWITNESGIDIKEDTFDFSGTVYKDVTIKIFDDSNEMQTQKSKLSDTEKENVVTSVLKLELDENKMYSYTFDFILSEGQEKKSNEFDLIENVLINDFDSARYKECGINEELITRLSNGVSINSASSKDEYLNRDNKNFSEEKFFSLIAYIPMLVFILSVFGASYIITSVNEEKSSKLVELILISVRPLALIMGKILAIIIFVMTLMGALVLGGTISSSIFGNNPTGQIFSMDILFSNGIVSFIMLLIEFIIAYFISAILAGILGSSCKTQEDMQSATGMLMMILMVGYFASFLTALDNDVVNNVIALVPMVSNFVLIPLFVTKKVSLIVVIISIILQILTLVLLVRLCAKVYKKLILSDQKKVKLLQIFKMLKKGE